MIADKKTIDRWHQLSKSDVHQALLCTVDEAKKYHETYNVFETIIDCHHIKEDDTLLSNIPYVLSDNISTKDILSTGSSEILSNFIPLYDATVYRKLTEAGALLIGKTTLDELSVLEHGSTNHNGMIKNPLDESRVIGSGAAISVATNLVPFGLASDTKGEVRKYAAYSGLVGFKPTYGRISRHGLFGLSSSLDTIAYFTNTVKDSAILTDILKGKDKYDMTSIIDDNLSYVEHLDSDVSNKKVFYIKQLCAVDAIKDIEDDELKMVLTEFQTTIETCKEAGFLIEEVQLDLDLLNAIEPTTTILTLSEATSNTANLTGVGFGVRAKGDNIDEIVTNSRTAGLSDVVKRRLILGSYILQKENQEKTFLNAKRVRRMIVDKMNDLFKQYDAMVMPIPVAPKIDSVSTTLKSGLAIENYLAIANLGGYPSITIPSGKVKGIPIGINITGAVCDDLQLLCIAQKLEEAINGKVGDKDV